MIKYISVFFLFTLLLFFSLIGVLYFNVDVVIFFPQNVINLINMFLMTKKLTEIERKTQKLIKFMCMKSNENVFFNFP